MAAIASAADGTWIAGAATTWVGGIAPSEGDTATIENTHDVEIDGNITVGADTATAAIEVKSGRRLFVPSTVAGNYTLTCKGDFKTDATGGTIEFGTCTYTTTGPAHGSLCMQVTTGGTGGAERRGWAVNGSDSTATQYFRFYLEPSSVTGTVSPLRGMNSGSCGQRFRVQVTAAGVLTLDHNAANTTLWTSSALSDSTQWRVEVAAGGSTSTTARVHIFDGDSTTASQDSGDLTGVNLGGPTREVWFGQTNAATNIALRLDDCGWSDTALLGPAATVAEHDGDAALSAASNLTAGGVTVCWTAGTSARRCFPKPT